MKQRAFFAEKLDLAAFARDGASLDGEWPATLLGRLTDSGAEEAPASGWPALRWQLHGEQRQARAAAAQTWLRVKADATVWLTCQRCLHPVEAHVEVDRWFHFVEDEKVAAEMDVDSEDDVLALPRHLDARELIEDELLLALPLVPRHDVCPKPLPMAASADPAPEFEAERPNPFAGLAALKKSPRGSGGDGDIG